MNYPSENDFRVTEKTLLWLKAWYELTRPDMHGVIKMLEDAELEIPRNVDELLAALRLGESEPKKEGPFPATGKATRVCPRCQGKPIIDDMIRCPSCHGKGRV